MSNINSIIIDDEINAIKTLEWELNGLDLPLSIVEKFVDVNDAIEYLTYHAHKIDLIFLDIQMPNMSGFDFLERFTNRNFEVIFVTAFDEYAIQAIRESAIDYILKPVEPEELTRAINKAINKKQVHHKTPQDFKKISIPVSNEIIFINPQDIVYFKSDGNYTHIYTVNDELMIAKTLKYIANLLPEVLFFRIHQSYIINLKYIVAFDKSTGYVKLTNQQAFPVSRSKKSEFLERL